MKNSMDSKPSTKDIPMKNNFLLVSNGDNLCFKYILL